MKIQLDFLWTLTWIRKRHTPQRMPEWYAVETIVPEPTTTVVQENSQSSETGTSQAIGTILFRFLELRLNKNFIEASIIE